MTLKQQDKTKEMTQTRQKVMLHEMIGHDDL